jgi:hypothetical protein
MQSKTCKEARAKYLVRIMYGDVRGADSNHAEIINNQEELKAYFDKEE